MNLRFHFFHISGVILLFSIKIYFVDIVKNHSQLNCPEDNINGV